MTIRRSLGRWLSAYLRRTTFRHQLSVMVTVGAEHGEKATLR